MKPRFIRIEADEAAEDRAMARLVDASTAEADIPFWFVELVALHGSPVAAARAHHGCTQADLARVLGIPPGRLDEIERGRGELTDLQRSQVAAHTGVEAGWLL